MAKNICIVHYNTPTMTRCLVMSINKYMPGSKIYIFDNSDVLPFVSTFDNVTVFDNTKGKIINFNAVLEKYPQREQSRGKVNNYGSAKHSMSIQKCIELINDNFILLDSDVLLRRDLSPLCDENYVWVAGVEEWWNRSLEEKAVKTRVCPFIVFMNVKKMKKMGITFFDDKHMMGLNNGPVCEEYETGVWFYEATPENLRKIIDYRDYVLHFRAASWYGIAVEKHDYKQMTSEKWLQKYREYWDD